MSGLFRDFNKIIPEKRIAKLADKEIDVSRLPSRTSIEMAIFLDNVLNGKVNNEQAALRSVEIVAEACNKLNPDLGITSDWLLDNTHYEQLIAFIDFVLEPINKPKEKESKKKSSQEK